MIGRAGHKAHEAGHDRRRARASSPRPFGAAISARYAYCFAARHGPADTPLANAFTR
ncbi:hypothetical protein BURPS668_2036 [Burkholderia pseudomallei 668]|nr:hypothetical protein BURPS668_2036 [Burkholderia pseudomallei 668]